MSRPEFREQLRTLYDLRLSGDVMGTLEYFHDQAAFRIATGDESIFPKKAAESTDLKAVFEQLYSLWEWQLLENWDTVLEGNQAAVHYTLTVRYVPNGNVLTTEVLDRLTFDDDGKIEKFVQFLDTIEIARVTAG